MKTKHLANGICRKQNASYSIFGIDLLFSKIYIITSPELMQSVQRSKALSLDPLLDLAVLRFSGITNKQTLDLLLDTSSGGQGFAQKLMHALAPTMIGKSLDQMNIRMVRFMTPLIDELGDKSSLDLYKWCRDAITDASNDTMFGPMSPFKDKEISDAFWWVWLSSQIRLTGLTWTGTMKIIWARSWLMRYLGSLHASP